ncbi:Mucin-associated surface protein (MASP) [Trypanosoma cruzi]|uniref:Mucin-associated surface protein (MASP) n=2 Tax=Trypanosoma cruzi TaxID=5693 RepID=A0A2V2WX36_TRYCR|nr:Mucin-associated surface protein (MASP), subgroup S004 [Trypanosoma cruzi]KAF8304159.1 Mucin-associated surface protein (MASP), subgroup S004 [Trypanosoma cruzi]PWV13027.1 Mucin-associated surface protein (MASP) [Trypanosoma cruzi]
MAMMMTGRVLLVCALCVLWCGAGGVFADEVVPVVEPPVISASGGVVTDKDTGRTAPGGAGNPSVEKTELKKFEGSAPGISSLEAASEIESTKQQTQSDHEHKDPVTPSQSSGEQRQDEQNEDPPEEPGASLGQEERKHALGGVPERNNPPSSSSNNNTVSSNSEERREDTSRSTEIIDAAPSDEGHERENVTPSLEQPLEASTAAPAITTQTSSITPPDESGSNTVKMSEASPQSTGTTQTNHTATPGDSDGSTAVFHSTSPLLLLLVACAAAAAVVSA